MTAVSAVILLICNYTDDQLSVTKGFLALLHTLCKILQMFEQRLRFCYAITSNFFPGLSTFYDSFFEDSEEVHILYPEQFGCSDLVSCVVLMDRSQIVLCSETCALSGLLICGSLGNDAILLWEVM